MPETLALEDPPLAGVRVIDFTRGPIAGVARMLGELGADVVRVEPRGGETARAAWPVVAGVSLAHVAANRGKAIVELDVTDPADRAKFDALLEDADILIEDTEPQSATWKALDAAAIAARRPGLVIVSISNFGQATSYASWQATTPVLLSLSGVIARSGIDGRPPLLPPGDLALECAVPQAAFATLLGFYNRLTTGKGERFDFSLLDAASQILDPGFGMTGSAGSGATPSALPRGRPPVGRAYPIIPCADGFVRLCVLAPRQWQGLFEWMGRPEEFADPSFNSLATRFMSPTLLPAITAFFAGKTRADLESAAQAHGVPAAAVLSLVEAVESEHAAARGAFGDISIGDGLAAPFPAGVLSIDGGRAAGPRTRPETNPHPPVRTERPDWPDPARTIDRPLSGLRVLDLGVIVVGGEQGRLLGDQGAEVIKVESAAYPDGARQVAGGVLISPNFAAGNRNKKSMGLNLRDPRGKALFLEMVRNADVILSNFKPGTLESLGLGPGELLAANPRLIVVDSSAFGPTGPWSRRLGYGPLVRAASGLTALWCYPDDDRSFSDSTTIYPDHVAARVGLVGVLSLMIRRLRSGRGGTVSVSQSEVMMSHMASRIAATALARSGAAPGGPEHDAPWGMFACAGEDEWCAVTVRSDAEWATLAWVIDRPDLADDQSLRDRRGRDAARARIDAAVAEWTAGRSPTEAMAALQAAGVPAGAMHRVTDLPEDPYYRERGFFHVMDHPYLAHDILVEGRLAQAAGLPNPPLAPAPLMAQHTTALARDILGLSAVEIEGLIADGVLEAPDYPPPA